MSRFSILALTLALVATIPAGAQAPDFEALLSGKDAPLTIRLSELTPEWRRAAITASDPGKSGGSDLLTQLMQLGMAGSRGASSSGEAAGMAVMSSLLGGALGGPRETICFTRGKTTTIAGEVFLIAYRYDPPQISLMALMAGNEKAGKEPDMAKLLSQGRMAPESVLVLSLLNVRQIGSLSGIRPFDLGKEIAESEKSSGLNALAAMMGTTTASSGATPVESPSTTSAPTASGRCAAVEIALRSDSKLAARGASAITVSEEGGAVVLRGWVRSATLKVHALNVAAGAVRGIGGAVRSALTIRASGGTLR